MRLLILCTPFFLALSCPVFFAARDCLRRPNHRYLPRSLWLMLVVFGWFVGAVVYYLWGRAPVPEFSVTDTSALPRKRRA